MAQIRGERKERLFLGEKEFKSQAEKKRVLKAEEEQVSNDVTKCIKSLVETYGEPLEVGEYIKLGCIKMTKKEKDGVPFVDFKVKL